MRQSDQQAALALRTQHTYALYGEIARGGMATIRLGRRLGDPLGVPAGPPGAPGVVAVKELHPQFAHDDTFVAMFRDEMQVAARVAHPNVVPILDIVSSVGQAMLIMEYVHGESVAQLQSLDRQRALQPEIAARIIVGVLRGLHAAHETRADDGGSLHIIHRDVTPQNVVVGIDGRPRLLDFGIARADGRTQTTRAGQIKGKLSYVSPEQLEGKGLDRRVDIYSASVMLWEMLTGRRLFSSRDRQLLEHLILTEPVAAPSVFNPAVTATLDAIVMRGLRRDPQERFPTAEAFADAIEAWQGVVPESCLGAWVKRTWGEREEVRARLVREIESDAGDLFALGVVSASPDAPAATPFRAQGEGAGAVHPGRASRSSDDDVITVSFRRSRPPMEVDLRAAPPPGDAVPPAARPRPRADVPRPGRGTLGAAAWLGAACAVAIAAGAAGYGASLPRHGGGRGGSEVAHEASPVPLPVPAPIQPLVTMLRPPASEAGVSGMQRSSTNGAARPRSSAAPGSGRTAAPRRGHPRVASRAAAHRLVSGDPSSCAVPYAYDVDGIKRFKPACL